MRALPPARLVPAILTGSVALFMAAWVAGAPPGEGPDEREHYVKAAGAGGGQLVGRKPPGLEQLADNVVKARDDDAPATTPEASRDALKQLGFNLKATREFDIPRRLTPSFRCSNLLVFRHPELPVRCRARKLPPPGAGSADEVVQGTYEGTYPPFLHVLPGLLIRTGDDAYSAYRIGRLGSALIALALIAAALFLLWDPRAGGLSLLGAVVALTPMAVFIGSMLNPSGPEVAGGLCFGACLMRLARAPSSPPPAWIWPALLASGATLALARPLGPLLVILMAAAGAEIAGPRVLASGLAAGGRRAGAATAGLAAAVAAGAFWEARYQARPDWTGADLADALGPSIERVPGVLREMVGLLAVEFAVPAYVYVPWAALLVGLLGLAVFAGNREQRIRLGLLTLGCLVLVVVLADLHRAATGSDQFKGRYALPFFTLVPLYAGEVVLAQRHRIADPVAARLIVAATTLAACLQLLAWWVGSRRVAVGTDGPFLFSSGATWEPPGGWVPWMLVAVLAALAYVLAGVTAARREVTS